MGRVTELMHDDEAREPLGEKQKLCIEADRGELPDARGEASPSRLLAADGDASDGDVEFVRGPLGPGDEVLASLGDQPSAQGGTPRGRIVDRPGDA